MGGKAQGAPKEFAAQLIAALEDAQAAAAVKKPASQLAQAAFNQLQFDFPVSRGPQQLAVHTAAAAARRRSNVKPAHPSCRCRSCRWLLPRGWQR